MVTVNTGNTFYVATRGGLANQITNQDLSTVVGNNGLFGPPGQFPANAASNRPNYFRDVIFVSSDNPEAHPELDYFGIQVRPWFPLAAPNPACERGPCYF